MIQAETPRMTSECCTSSATETKLNGRVQYDANLHKKRNESRMWCVAGCPSPSRPVPSCPVPSRPVPSRPVPSRPVPSRPVPSRPVPSHPIPSHPVWVKWWLLVLAWDNWSTWSINVYMHIYGISGKVSHLSHTVPSRPVLSRPIPSRPILYGSNGGYWCWPGTIGPHGPSMYTCKYMASQARCPACPIPSRPVPSHPVQPP